MSGSYLSTYQQTLTAAVPARFGLGGRKFILMDAAAAVSVRFINGQGTTVGEMESVIAGVSVRFEQDFAAVELVSAVGQAVKVATASDDVEFNHVSGNVTATRQQATALALLAPVTVGVATVPVMAADTSRMVATFTNDPASPGIVELLAAAGDTYGKGTIILHPGESYTDDVSAAAARYAAGEFAGCTLRIEVGT